MQLMSTQQLAILRQEAAKIKRWSPHRWACGRYFPTFCSRFPKADLQRPSWSATNTALLQVFGKPGLFCRECAPFSASSECCCESAHGGTANEAKIEQNGSWLLWLCCQPQSLAFGNYNRRWETVHIWVQRSVLGTTTTKWFGGATWRSLQMSKTCSEIRFRLFSSQVHTCMEQKLTHVIASSNSLNALRQNLNDAGCVMFWSFVNAVQIECVSIDPAAMQFHPGFLQFWPL